ncbi:MAG: hypothetical protein RLZZ306_2645 [Bacteroidota bacterium]|jgi:hypothetical protein
MKIFSDVVEEVKELTLDEKEDLMNMLKNIIIEERRNDILQNYEDSKQETRQFTNNMSDLRKRMTA